jgi:hypothetical protein
LYSYDSNLKPPDFEAEKETKKCNFPEKKQSDLKIFIRIGLLMPCIHQTERKNHFTSCAAAAGWLAQT